MEILKETKTENKAILRFYDKYYKLKPLIGKYKLPSITIMDKGQVIAKLK